MALCGAVVASAPVASAMNPPSLPYGVSGVQLPPASLPVIPQGENSQSANTALPMSPVVQWPPTPPSAAPGEPQPPTGDIFAPVHPSEALASAENSSGVANADLSISRQASSTAQVKLSNSEDRLALLEANLASFQATLSGLELKSSSARATLVADGIAAYLASGTSQPADTSSTTTPDVSMSPSGVMHEEAVMALQYEVKRDTAAWSNDLKDISFQRARLAYINSAIPAARNDILQESSRLAAANAAVSWNTTAATNADQLTALLKLVSSDSAIGIPHIVLSAYQWAAQYLSVTQPTCGISWPDLAAIGQLESDQGRFDGARLASNGDVYPPILGPPLNGMSNNAMLLAPTSNIFDGHGAFEQAVGPLQFLPSTWQTLVSKIPSGMSQSPNNIFSAALAAGTYLCNAAGSQSMTTLNGLQSAYSSYNHSSVYVSQAIDYAQRFGAQVTVPAAG